MNVEEAAMAYFHDVLATGQAVAASGGAAQAAAAAAPTCGCSKNCLSKFDPGTLEQTSLNFAEMEKSEQELIILGLLEASRYAKYVTTHGSKRKKQ